MKRAQRKRVIEQLLERVDAEGRISRSRALDIRVRDGVIVIHQRAALEPILCAIAGAILPFVWAWWSPVSVLLFAFYISILVWYVVFTPRVVIIDPTQRFVAIEPVGWLGIHAARVVRPLRAMIHCRIKFEELGRTEAAYESGARSGKGHWLLFIRKKTGPSIRLAWSRRTNFRALVTFLNVAVCGKAADRSGV